MRLVGATDGFIRRPFLIEGSIKGVLGGMLALVLTYLAMRTLEQYLHFETVFFDRRMALARHRVRRADGIDGQRGLGGTASAARMTRGSGIAVRGTRIRRVRRRRLRRLLALRRPACRFTRIAQDARIRAQRDTLERIRREREALERARPSCRTPCTI